MKPHRVVMAHNLAVNYGLDKKMDILVSKGMRKGIRHVLMRHIFDPHLRSDQLELHLTR